MLALQPSLTTNRWWSRFFLRRLFWPPAPAFRRRPWDIKDLHSQEKIRANGLL